MYIPEYGFHTCTIFRFTSEDSSIALSGIHELKVTVREDQLLTWSQPPNHQTTKSVTPFAIPPVDVTESATLKEPFGIYQVSLSNSTGYSEFTLQRTILSSFMSIR